MSRKSHSDGPKKAESRNDRLKAALKANLSRRKAQAAKRDQKNSEDKAG